ncbi:hypothetical protein D3C77_739390 [compost metagenome]
MLATVALSQASNISPVAIPMTSCTYSRPKRRLGVKRSRLTSVALATMVPSSSP